METTDNHTPTPEELTLCIEESAVRAADACEQSPAVLRVDGSVIGTLGNFSASIGKAKSKKTFNVAALTVPFVRAAAPHSPKRSGASSTSTPSRDVPTASRYCGASCGWRDCPRSGIPTIW